MNVRVCVPWRPGDAGRSEAWTFIRAFWRQHGFDPVSADSDPAKPFNRGQARNRAAQGAWDVAVFADACVLPQIQNVQRAIDAAHNVRLVHAHSRVVRLSGPGTRDVIENRKLPQSASVTRTTGPWTPGGVFAIGRALYDAIGGWDEVFEGWGGEDTAFVGRAHRQSPRMSIAGDCWHLWHAHSDRDLNSVAFRRNRLKARALARQRTAIRCS